MHLHSIDPSCGIGPPIFFDCWWALFGNRAAENSNEGAYFLIVGGLYSVTALRKITMRVTVYTKHRLTLKTPSDGSVGVLVVRRREGGREGEVIRVWENTVATEGMLGNLNPLGDGPIPTTMVVFFLWFVQPTAFSKGFS